MPRSVNCRTLRESTTASFSLIERGLREPSITALTAIANALGADASIRLFPGAGPRLRDPLQARIGEALLRILNPRWDRMLEVPVVRPARGFIDLVLLDRPPTVAICTEIQSELRRLEQLIRWANEKALALPSAPFWDRIGETPSIERLLVIRSTRSNREIATRFAETLGVAYPCRTSDGRLGMARADASLGRRPRRPHHDPRSTATRRRSRALGVPVEQGAHFRERPGAQCLPCQGFTGRSIQTGKRAADRRDRARGDAQLLHA